ncbi:hypothetical protein NEUTE1DRAFT_125380 [Neurospora tetrasperma FGSC 2508]|uniref:Uncharacterized protein n=1 Tax=Neurospora tetrasperma (strain FGSC 2508 / ATCC MYA-4615 / P0657) TaxID=510951 RepID=F8N3B5_NEUT8|nr:uncharacterized protein NEUTE1DRAFT_125380 [Neurospora tetrasperma FGSC 2508]EGO51722.1 hypothetical protein NEUTE1DRAFT_125380 [Neurospora tetrasperma FGSC 2508]EGZ78278.1 hypothetical protein NEUTE2DRAFT_147538 [Neurospora tetrasperma FGSC 2509]
MATYPHQASWIHDIATTSLEVGKDGFNDATACGRPSESQPSTGIRNHAYHEEIAQSHINIGEEGPGRLYDDDDGTMSEGYLHADGKFEESVGDQDRLRSPIRGEEKEIENQNPASNHASAGNSPREDGGDASSYSGITPNRSFSKAHRNNSNSAELMLQGVSSRSPTPSQSRQSPERLGYNLGGYFQSCEDCFIAGMCCIHRTAAATIVMPDGRGSLIHDGGHGNGRAARERHEWLVERMKESLAKIDSATHGDGVGSRGGA